MEIYKLDGGFVRQDLIEGAKSSIWTERYISPGDFQIVLPDSKGNRELLPKGTLLGLPGSKEVMLVDTVLIKDKLINVTGSDLLGFLSERIFRNVNVFTTSKRVAGASVGQIIANIVQQLIDPGSYQSNPSASDFATDDAHEAIPNLSFGAIDTSSTVGTALFPYQFVPGGFRRETAEALSFGPMLNVLLQLAEPANLGMSLYLDSATPTGYSLKFTVYAGADRTSDQDANPLVRFSPNTESLSGVSELHSDKGAKTVAYGYPTTAADPSRSDLSYIPQVAYLAGFDPSTMGFARRSMMVAVSDIDQDTLATITTAQLSAAVLQRAINALANNTYTKVVDGEIIPQSGYVYGEDYALGDIVELESAVNERSKARVTEYIRTQERSVGDRAYPTISVI